MEKRIGERTDRPTEQDRLLAVVCHAGTILGFAVIAPLIIYLAQKDGSPFLKFHAIQSVFFQLVMSVVVIGVALLTCGVGSLLLVPWFAVELWMAFRAYNGEWAAYPMMENVGRG